MILFEKFLIYINGEKRGNKMRQRFLKSILVIMLGIWTLTGCNKQAQVTNEVIAKDTNVEVKENKTPVNLEELKQGPTNRTTCEVSTDGLIKTVEVNQVMSYGMDHESGEFYLINDFVAGKDTAIYIPLTQEVEIDTKGNTQYLKVIKDDIELATLPPTGRGETDVLCFKPQKLEDVESWSEGEYRFEVTVGESWGTRNAIFKTAKKVKVLAVPIKANYGGRVVDVGEEWKNAIKFTSKVYPLGREDIEYVYAPTLDLSGDKYDLYTEEGMYNTWRALCYLQTPKNEYELVLGFVRERLGPTSTYQGFTCGLPANIIVESDGDMQATVAHEIAHCYSVGDEYEGGVFNELVNPAPYGMQGLDWNNREEEVVGKQDFIISGRNMGKSASGTVVFEEQRPVDLSGQLLNQNVTSFMGSGSSDLKDYWITSAIWEQLYRAFVGPTNSSVTQNDYEMNNPHNVSEEGDNCYFNCYGCYQNIALDKCNTLGYCESCNGLIYFDFLESEESFKCEWECGENIPITTDNLFFECYNCEDITSFYQILSQYEALEEGEIPIYSTAHITGTIDKKGAFNPEVFEKSYVEADQYITTNQGEYGIYMEDESGEVLYSYLFDISFSNVSVPNLELEAAPIDLNVKCPSMTRNIVVKKGDQVLYRQEVSIFEPEVTVDIEEGITLNGEHTIKWNGTDEDGDELTYSVWYYGDGDPVCLVNRTKETSCKVNFDELPGSDMAWIEVEANDGFLVTNEWSSNFIVDYKAPIILTDNVKVELFKLTDYITLEVDAYDLQCGWNSDLDFVWTDEEGEEICWDYILEIAPYSYEPGEHQFTLTVSNWESMSVTKDFKVKVVDDESALINDWSREEIRIALQSGFDLPVDEMGGAITRGEFAKLVCKYYEMISNDYCILFEWEGIEDCDWRKDPYPFYLLEKGLIQVPDQLFRPDDPITQLEALELLMACTEKGDAEFYEAIKEYDTKLSIPKTLIEVNVLNETGPNKFEAEKVLTKEQAMVRVIRLLCVFLDYEGE